jgi:hypothetical protein
MSLLEFCPFQALSDGRVMHQRDYLVCMAESCIQVEHVGTAERGATSATSTMIKSLVEGSPVQ